MCHVFFFTLKSYISTPVCPWLYSDAQIQILSFLLLYFNINKKKVVDKTPFDIKCFKIVGNEFKTTLWY